MQRLYAVLKCIISFFSVTTGVFLVISIFHLMFYTNNLKEFHGIGEKTLAGLVLLGLFWLAYIMCRFGYRLFMRVRASGDLKRKKPLSPIGRKLWAAIYLISGALLMIGFLGTIDKDPAVAVKHLKPGDNLLVQFWSTLAVMLVGSALLLRSGYKLCRPVKETAALPAQQI